MALFDHIFVFFQQLHLTQNNINFTHHYAFRGLKTLHTLDMSNNRLTSAPYLAEAKFTLRMLDLEWNSIKHIEDSYFNSFISIMHIHIGNNELIQLPNLQNIAKTIIVFSVDGNRLSDANFMYGNSYPKLKNLNLQFNQIRVFCPPPGNIAPRLHSIYLQSNKLSSLRFPYDSQRQALDVMLENNPLHCDGSLGWTQQCQIQDRHSYIMECMGWLSLWGMVCHSPLEVQGLTPKDASNRTRKCSTKGTLIRLDLNAFIKQLCLLYWVWHPAVIHRWYMYMHYICFYPLIVVI